MPLDLLCLPILLATVLCAALPPDATAVLPATQGCLKACFPNMCLSAVYADYADSSRLPAAAGSKRRLYGVVP